MRWFFLFDIYYILVLERGEYMSIRCWGITIVLLVLFPHLVYANTIPSFYEYNKDSHNIVVKEDNGLVITNERITFNFDDKLFDEIVYNISNTRNLDTILLAFPYSSATILGKEDVKIGNQVILDLTHKAMKTTQNSGHGIPAETLTFSMYKLPRIKYLPPSKSNMQIATWSIAITCILLGVILLIILIIVTILLINHLRRCKNEK